MEGQNPDFHPQAIPAQQKCHPQTSVCLLPGSPEPLDIPSLAVTSLHKLFTDILSRCTRCGCGYRLRDCLPHPPFCIPLSQTVHNDQITLVLRSQPAQPLHTRLTRALEDTVHVQSSQQTPHELLQSTICLISIFAEVNCTNFFFTLFKANTQMTGCC